jgi:hypothetical protein
VQTADSTVTDIFFPKNRFVEKIDNFFFGNGEINTLYYLRTLKVKKVRLSMFWLQGNSLFVILICLQHWTCPYTVLSKKILQKLFKFMDLLKDSKLLRPHDDVQLQHSGHYSYLSITESTHMIFNHSICSSHVHKVHKIYT